MLKKLFILLFSVITVFSISFSVFAEEIPDFEITDEISTETDTETDFSETITESDPPSTTEEVENDSSPEIISTDYSSVLSEINTKLFDMNNFIFCNSCLTAAMIIILVMFKR